jgi:hypothetical protein
MSVRVVDRFLPDEVDAGGFTLSPWVELPHSARALRVDRSEFEYSFPESMSLKN